MMRVANTQEVNVGEAVDTVSSMGNENEIAEQTIATAIIHPNPTSQLLLSSKLIIHRPEAGLNPLVDAAAYLFSVMGKLKHIKSYQNLSKLHDELIEEIERFQETIQTYSYNEEYIAEYIPITCYAICMTLDDIITGMPWGDQGKWDEYRLVTSFNQEPLSPKTFLIILERLIRDPAIYIDVMEFMYICLSMGFKCNHNNTSFNHEQLEQITNSLYKRIRAHRGNFSKMLSPFSIKPPQANPQPSSKSMSSWLIILLTSCFFVTAFGCWKLFVG